jgi:hypothetical protein
MLQGLAYRKSFWQFKLFLTFDTLADAALVHDDGYLNTLGYLNTSGFSAGAEAHIYRMSDLLMLAQKNLSEPYHTNVQFDTVEQPDWVGTPSNVQIFRKHECVYNPYNPSRTNNTACAKEHTHDYSLLSRHCHLPDGGDGEQDCEKIGDGIRDTPEQQV